MTGGETVVPGLTEVAEISEVVNGEGAGSSASSCSETGPTRITRVSNIECRATLDLDTKCDDDLEVIHVKKKKSKKRTSRKKRTESESDQVSVSSYTPSPVTPESGLANYDSQSLADSMTGEPADGSDGPQTVADQSTLVEGTVANSSSSSNLLCNIDTRESRVDSSSSIDSKSRASSDVSNTTSSAVGSMSDQGGSFIPIIPEQPCGSATQKTDTTETLPERTALVGDSNTTQVPGADCEPKLMHDITDIRRLSEEFSIYDNSPEECPNSKPMDPVLEEVDQWSASIQELDLETSKCSPGLPCKTKDADIPTRLSPTDSGNGSLCNGSDSVDASAAEAVTTDTTSDEEVKVPADYKEHLEANLKEDELAVNKQQLVHPNEIR